jgi:hypothetical protein
MGEKTTGTGGEGMMGLVLTEAQTALVRRALKAVTLAAPSLESPPKAKGGFAVTLSEEDWEEVAGWLTRQALSVKDQRKQRGFDALIEKIEDALLFDPEEDD